MHAAWWLLGRAGSQPTVPKRSIDFKADGTREWIVRDFDGLDGDEVFQAERAGPIAMNDTWIADTVLLSVEDADGAPIQPPEWSGLILRHLAYMKRLGDPDIDLFRERNMALLASIAEPAFAKKQIDRSGVAAPLPQSSAPLAAAETLPSDQAAPLGPAEADREAPRQASFPAAPASAAVVPLQSDSIVLGSPQRGPDVRIGVIAVSCALVGALAFTIGRWTAGDQRPGTRTVPSSPAAPALVHTLYAHPDKQPRTPYARLGAALRDEIRRHGVTLSLAGSEASTNAAELAKNPLGFAFVEATTPLSGFALPLAQPYIERLQLVYNCDDGMQRAVHGLDTPEDRRRSGWRCPPLILGACEPEKPCSNDIARTLIERAFAENRFTAGDAKKSAHKYIPALARALGVPVPKASGAGAPAYGRGVPFEAAIGNFGKPGNDLSLALFVSGKSQSLENARDRCGVIGMDRATFGAVLRETHAEWSEQLRFVELGYPGIDNVETLGVPALLVAGDGVPPDVRYKMMSSLCALREAEDVKPLLKELKLYRGPLIEHAGVACSRLPKGEN
jgi:hypothetical protein